MGESGVTAVTTAAPTLMCDVIKSLGSPDVHHVGWCSNKATSEPWMHRQRKIVGG